MDEASETDMIALVCGAWVSQMFKIMWRVCDMEVEEALWTEEK